jgi:hydrogenase-1 operon protein HyaF
MSFTMPPMGFGPGTQPGPEDGAELRYMAMPSGMSTFETRLPQIDDPSKAAAALAFMGKLADAAEVAAARGDGGSFALDDLDAFNRAVLAEVMHEGEVSVTVDGDNPAKIQEAVFAGVWRVRRGGVETIEIGAAPAAVLNGAHAPVAVAGGRETPLRDRLMSGPALVEELLDKAATHPSGELAHVINLTLLPHSPEDLDFLDAALGTGAVTVLSRGYGNCRVDATAVPRVWRVRFFNSMDQLILDTLEVCDVPEVVLAAPEDLRDTAERLREAAEALR